MPVEAARAVARRQRRWRYIELAGIGHVPQLQVPEQLAGHLGGWLRDLRSTTSGSAPGVIEDRDRRPPWSGSDDAGALRSKKAIVRGDNR